MTEDKSTEGMVMYVVGHRYPAPLPYPVGAFAEFLTNHQNMLCVINPAITDQEVRDFLTRPVEVGMMFENNAILFVWALGGGEPQIIFDTPFNVKSIDKRFIPKRPEDQAKLTIKAFLIDGETEILRAIRVIELPPALTHDFYSAIQEQLASPVSPDIQVDRWYRQDPLDLFQQVTRYEIKD